MLVLGLFGLGLVFLFLAGLFKVNSGFRQGLCEGWSRFYLVLV